MPVSSASSRSSSLKVNRTERGAGLFHAGDLGPGAEIARVADGAQGLVGPHHILDRDRAAVGESAASRRVNSTHSRFGPVSTDSAKSP